jgi:protein TonB
MVNHNKLFLFSGFIAISFYLSLLIVLAYFLMHKDEVIPVFSTPEETHYTIELEEIVKKREDKIVIKDVKQPKPKVEEKKVLKKEGSLSVKEKTSFKSLFKDLDPKLEKTTKNTEVQTKQRTEVASRKYGQKIANKQTSKSTSEIMKQLKDIDKVSIVDKKDGLYDEYISKIEKILIRKYNRAIRIDGEYRAEVLVKIDNMGNMSYKIVKLSPDNNYNTQLNIFLDQLRLEKFPPYTGGIEIVIKTNFKVEDN